jgi:hypothetical protein
MRMRASGVIWMPLAQNLRVLIRGQIRAKLLQRESGMDLKSFVDRATDAANKAAQKAQDAVNTISATTSTPAPAPETPTEPAPPDGAEDPAEGTELTLAEGPLPATVAPPAPVPAPSKSFSDFANELSAAGSQKIQELVNSFQQSLPAIKSAGYELTEFEVELGVTPKLIPHFKHGARAVEDVEAARAMLKDNKLGLMILNALLKAGDVHKHIRMAHFGFSHIEIELGLIPCVRLQYKRD